MINFVPMAPGDLVFAALMAFGIAACSYGIYRGFRNPDSTWLYFCPTFAAFGLFPLVNVLIGVAICLVTVYEHLTRTKT